MDDLISRQAALDAIFEYIDEYGDLDQNGLHNPKWCAMCEAKMVLEDLPSVQPEPLSDAYMKAVWTWLLDYQIKMAELKGRYTPYEVLSWVANDWRKEHGG